MKVVYANGTLSNYTNVYQNNVINDEEEQWSIKNVIGDYYMIYATNSSYCMDVCGAQTNNGTNIHIYQANRSEAQIFKLKKISEQTVVEQNVNEELEEGIYIIASSLDTTKVLDVAGASQKDGANIQLYQSNNSSAQQYKICRLENGSYTLSAVCSGKMLTIEYGTSSNGANVFQGTEDGKISQQWKIIAVGNGDYCILSAQNGKALDIVGANANSGVNVQIYQPNMTMAQKFKLIPAIESESVEFVQESSGTAVINYTVKLKGKANSSDNKYYLMKAESSTNQIYGSPLASVDAGNDISISARVSSRSELREIAMNQVVLAIKVSNGNYQAITEPIYISNPDEIADDKSAIFKGTSKKGLQGIYYASYDGGNDVLEARNANTKQTLINLDLATVVSTYPKAGYKAYTYKGNIYYFSELSALKANIRSLNIGYKQYLNGNSGTTPVAVTLCLLLSYNPENSFLIDPAARTPGHSYYTLNVREEYARETLEALFLYLGETFGQQLNGDDPYSCYVSNWVLGNEINSSRAWNYSGSLDFDTYMECYATAFRMLYNGVKSEKTGNTVSISLDNGWTAAPDTYAGKTTLDAFAKKIHAQNPNIDWSIAYHPYSYPLTRADFWNDYSNTTDSLSTPYISMRNISVLTNYAGTLESIYGKAAGSIRVLLTEQGYSYAAGAETQAMAIARGYYIAQFNDRIDAFIIRAVVDDADEASGRLYFGLMNSQQEKRIAFYVYEYMDSSRSGFASESSSVVSAANQSKFEAAKSIVCNTNWSSIIPGFDDSKLAAIK